MNDDSQSSDNSSNSAPQIINQDGKQYSFSPGPQGSLTVMNQGKPAVSLLTQTGKSKVIGPISPSKISKSPYNTGHGYAMAGEHRQV